MEQKQYVFTIVIDGVAENQRLAWLQAMGKLCADYLLKEPKDIVMDIQEFPVVKGVQ